MMNRKWTKHFVLGLVAVGLALSGTALAGDVEIDGSVRVREMFELNYDHDSDADDHNNFATMRTRIGFWKDVGEYSSVYVQFQDTRVLGEPTNTLTNLEQTDLHQGYMHLHNLFNSPLELKIGRQEMKYGTERQIGPVGFSDVGRAFDGMKLMYDIENFGWFHVFAMKTKETGGPVGPVNDGANITTAPNGETAFLGGYLHYDVNEQAQAEVYVFDNYMDMGDLPTSGDNATGNLITAGGRVKWYDEDLGVKVYAEGAYQFGSEPDSEDLAGLVVAGNDFAGYAAVAGAKYGLPTEVPVWIGAEFNLASGDDDFTDNEIKTYQQLFPTTHGALGYMDFVAWQNIMSITGTIGVQPAEQWKVWASYHMFQVMEEGDDWYTLDGRDVRLSGDPDYDSTLASEVDFSVVFMPEESLKLEGFFGVWLPGDWQEQATAGSATTPADLDPAYRMFVAGTVRF